MSVTGRGGWVSRSDVWGRGVGVGPQVWYPGGGTLPSRDACDVPNHKFMCFHYPGMGSHKNKRHSRSPERDKKKAMKRRRSASTSSSSDSSRERKSRRFRDTRYFCIWRHIVDYFFSGVCSRGSRDSPTYPLPHLPTPHLPTSPTHLPLGPQDGPTRAVCILPECILG